VFKFLNQNRQTMRRSQHAVTWFVLSAAIALFGFWYGPAKWLLYDRGNDIQNAEVTTVCIWVGWCWIGSFVLAVTKLGRLALWLTLLAPLPLFWPAVAIIFGQGCSIFGCH
jgi:hypothetical protein